MLFWLLASWLAMQTIWASLIAKQIHQAPLKRSTFIPFYFLIYRLYLESGVESLHHLDLLIEV